MPLDQNLAIAAQAVAVARTYIRGSANRISDRIAAAGGIEAIIEARTGKCMKLTDDLNTSRAKIFPTLVDNPEVDTTKIANGAIASGVGNCHELAAVAFEWLRLSNVTPIDLMKFTAQGYDHVWVVIGRVNQSDMTNLRSWGPDAVWCDPWQGDNGVAFGIRSFVRGEVRNLNWIYKCNTVERVEAGIPGVITRS